MTFTRLMKKCMSAALGVAAAVCLLPPAPALAASSYTVTYRPGEVGSFADAQSLADSYVRDYAGVTDAAVTANGAVKLTVAAGEAVPAAPQADKIKPEEGYFVKSTAQWGPSQADTVSKNTDYVVDYGRLVNGVEYTVSFTDAATGVSIAPPSTIYGNVGTEVSYTAPASIVNSETASYVLNSERTVTIVLSEKSEANQISFSYANTYDPGTQVIENVITVPGTPAEQAPTPQPQPAGGAAQDAGAAGDEGGAVVIPDNETPLAENPGETQTETPGQAEGNTDDNGGNVTITDDETPLAEKLPQSYTAVAAAVIFGVAAAALLLIWLKVKKNGVFDSADKK